MTKVELQRIIGANIKKYRAMRGITQETLADSVGISVPFCAQLESGNRAMSLLVLYKFSIALEISLDSLISEDGKQVSKVYVTNLLDELSEEQLDFVADFINLMHDKVW